MKRMSTITIVRAAALALAAIAPAASAGTTSVDLAGSKGVNNLAAFTGHATYDNVTHVLSITIDNTTAHAKGGYVTGLVFNGAGKATYQDGDNLATKKPDEDAFDDAMGKKKKAIKIKKAGTYEAGVGLDGKVGANNKAVRGVAVGASRTFNFKLSGSGADSMTAASLFGNNGGLLVSFGGLNDKKKVDLVGGKLQPAAVTEPVKVTPSDPILSGGDTSTGSTTTGGSTSTGGTSASGGSSTTGTGTNGRPTVPGIVTPPVTSGGGLPGDLPTSSSGGLESGGTSTSGGTPPAAVPLPPAAFPGLIGMAMVGFGYAKRRFRMA